MWIIRYSPHRIETTAPMFLGRCTWVPSVTWNGYHAAYCVWATG